MGSEREIDVGRWISIDERGVTVEVEGEIALDTLPVVLHALTGHPRFDPSLATVWDFSRSSGLGSFPKADVVASVRAIARMRRGAGRPRIGLVAPKDVDFGVLRMFEGFGAEQLPVELGIFRDGREARRWAFERPRREESGAEPA